MPHAILPQNISSARYGSPPPPFPRSLLTRPNVRPSLNTLRSTFPPNIPSSARYGSPHSHILPHSLIRSNVRPSLNAPLYPPPEHSFFCPIRLSPLPYSPALLNPLKCSPFSQYAPLYLPPEHSFCPIWLSPLPYSPALLNPLKCSSFSRYAPLYPPSNIPSARYTPPPPPFPRSLPTRPNVRPVHKKTDARPMPNACSIRYILTAPGKRCSTHAGSFSCLQPKKAQWPMNWIR